MAKKKRESSFRGRVNADAKRQNEGGSSYGYLKLPNGVSVYKPTPGNREKFDVIPYVVSDTRHADFQDGFPAPGDIWYKRPFKVHKNVGAENETYVCLTTFGKKCPICEHRKQRAKDGGDKDEIKSFNSKERALYVVIPRSIKKTEEELHIMDMSWWLFQKQLNEDLQEDDSYEMFPDPEEGYTLKVRWNEESHQGNTYPSAGRIDFIEREEAIDEDTLKNVPDLDKVLIELSYQELHDLFFELQGTTPSEEEEEEEERPRRKSKPESKSTRKPAKQEKEEEDIDLTWADLQDMGEEELAEVIDSKKLDIDPEDYDGESDLREAVAEELGVEKTKKRSSSEPEAKEKESKPSKEEKHDSSNKCPSGFKYGVDTDKYDECDTCKLWEKCDDKKEED